MNITSCVRHIPTPYTSLRKQLRIIAFAEHCASGISFSALAYTAAAVRSNSITGGRRRSSGGNCASQLIKRAHTAYVMCKPFSFAPWQTRSWLYKIFGGPILESWIPSEDQLHIGQLQSTYTSTELKFRTYACKITSSITDDVYTVCGTLSLLHCMSNAKFRLICSVMDRVIF